MNIIKQSIATLFHPSDSFIYLKKQRGKTNYTPVFVLVGLAIVFRIISIFIEHFPLASILPKDANIWMEIVRIFVPYILTVIACYAVTTILDGATTFSETLIAGAYSLLPYIIFVLPVTLFSHILSGSASGLYGSLHKAIWLWVILLFFISMKSMNEYELGEAIGVAFLTLVTMAVIVGIFLLFFALTSQAIDFIREVFLEIKLLL